MGSVVNSITNAINIKATLEEKRIKSFGKRSHFTVDSEGKK